MQMERNIATNSIVLRLQFILNRHEGGSSTGGHLKGRVILGRHTPPKNEALQQKLNEIIDEATNGKIDRYPHIQTPLYVELVKGIRNKTHAH